MSKYSSRLSQLECKLAEPNHIHIIMKSYCGQESSEAFDVYQAKRTAEGYTPQKCWKELKAEFLSDDNGIDGTMFIAFEILNSVGPTPPKVTNAKKTYELKVL